MAEDIVRVLRIIEYVGPRSKVEQQIERSIQGTRTPGNGVTIRAATLGAYPEILNPEPPGTAVERFMAKLDALVAEAEAGMTTSEVLEAVQKCNAATDRISRRISHDS